MRKSIRKFVMAGLVSACVAMTATACDKNTDANATEASNESTQVENENNNTEGDNMTTQSTETQTTEQVETTSMNVSELDTSGELIKKETETATGETTKEEVKTDENGVEVECPKDVYTKRKDMEYGKVEHITYHSETTGLDRGANVMLPAGYTTDKKYPVVYFQHGIFGDEYSMINDGNNHIPEIFGNLAADGRTREAIVVFTNMYATSDPELKPGFTDEQIAPYDNFINDLVNDLMPYMEANYSILTGRDNTAVLGFSMGGRESLYIGVTRPDLFAYTGAISPAPGVVPCQDWAMYHKGQMAEDELKITDTENLPKLLMVCCGTKDGVVGTFPKSYHELMVKNGVEHMWYEIPGADHDNKAIRSGIYNFLIRWNEE